MSVLLPFVWIYGCWCVIKKKKDMRRQTSTDKTKIYDETEKDKYRLMDLQSNE